MQSATTTIQSSSLYFKEGSSDKEYHAAIARMHADDQDVIDDFLLEIARRGLILRG